MDDPRRTRFVFQREGISLSCPDNLLSKNFYLMIISDLKSYYHAQKDPRWQVAMDEEMNSLQKKHYFGASFSSSEKEIGSMQVGVSE